MAEKIRRRRAFDLAVGLLVAAGLFAVGEVAVRMLGWQPQEWPAIGKMSAFREVRADPLLGPLARPEWSGKWFGIFQTKIDERGNRSSGLPPLSAAEGRVAFLGDSCTFGWGVDTAQTYVAQLDAMQREHSGAKRELVNLGYPGQSAVVGEYMLRERALPLRPELVVLAYSANNAFRFSITADRDRFHWFSLRKLVLQSRLFHLIAAWLANRSPQTVLPRDREAIRKLPFADVERVATDEEFEKAIRTMVHDARSAGAGIAFLILPRASGVSTDFAIEDAAVAGRAKPASKSEAPAELSRRDLSLIESSCLNHKSLADPAAALDDLFPRWQPVYPSDPAVRAQLQKGARAYTSGDYAGARREFAEAVRLQPKSPLAHYDLGAADLMLGNSAEGLRSLGEADALACNVFLHYQVVLRKIAVEMGVPVVDISLYFQADEGGSLFLDGAHPNARGHAIIAEALLPLIQGASAK